MNDATLAFLQTLGATLDGDDCRFPAEPAFDALGDADVIVPLSHYGILSIEGPEAEQFLQGQITCSAPGVTPALSSPGAYCTPKGRVVASFQLLRPRDDAFWLRMRGDLLETAARAFGKYIVFSKAKLATVDLVGIGLHGAGVGAVLRDLLGALPETQHATVGHGDGLLLRGDADGTRFEYWGPAAAATALWSHCAPRCTAVGPHYWRHLQIRAGNAEICAATSELFLPHQLNYHATGAINFNKGCYTGQEIVARTHYRGQVKRHLLCATVNGPAPAAGSAITDTAGKAVGDVVNGVDIRPGAAEILAIVADAVIDGESADGPAVLRAGAAELQVLAL